MAIECISAASVAILPLIIFKAKDTSTAQVPINTPLGQYFLTSNSGWTLNSHAYKWLTTVFKPLTKPADATQRQLLIMDRHRSHITVNVIAHCMEYVIDLLILPPHTLHMLQPLDVSVFLLLKHALAAETDAASQVNAGCIIGSEWTHMYICARETAL